MPFFPVCVISRRMLVTASKHNGSIPKVYFSLLILGSAHIRVHIFSEDFKSHLLYNDTMERSTNSKTNALC